MSQKFRIFSFAVLVSVSSAPFVLAADENGGFREISDDVYSFTLGEGNHSMFVIGEDGVAVFETFHTDHSRKLLEAVRRATKKDQVRALLKSIGTGDPGAVAVVNESKYIQHNPQTHEGSEGLAALFQRLSKTSPRVNIVRAFEDGDFVFAHTEYDFASRKIGFEVFRFENVHSLRP